MSLRPNRADKDTPVFILDSIQYTWPVQVTVQYVTVRQIPQSSSSILYKGVNQTRTEQLKESESELYIMLT